MKHKGLKKSLLAAALALSLGGCGAQGEEIKPNGEDTELEGYKQAIAALESELQQEREAHYITKSELTAEIVELQERLSHFATGGGEESAETVEFRYRVENGKAIITGYKGEAAILSLPSELDGYPVCAIGERAFEGAALTAVMLPSGVESIGWFAFYGCKGLISISMPESVSLIGYAVFEGCPKVTVFCPADCYAQRYAQSYGIAFVNT